MENANLKKMLDLKKQNFKIYKSDAIKFLKKLPNNSLDVIATDPAYSGMNNHLMLGKGRIVGKYKDKGKKDSKWFNEFQDSEENYRVFLSEAFRVLKPDSHIFIMFDSYSLVSLSHLVREYFNLKNIIVWDKVHIGMGHYFRRQSEFIIFACKGKRRISSRSINDVWPIKRLTRAPYPTQKPVELFSRMIMASKHKEDKEYIVCDPFLGSASCGVAALKNNCKFIGSDISNESILMSKKRLKEYQNNKIDIYEKTKDK